MGAHPSVSSAKYNDIWMLMDIVNVIRIVLWTTSDQKASYKNYVDQVLSLTIGLIGSHWQQALDTINLRG